MTINDAFKAGAAFAAGLFLLVYMRMMFAAESLTETVGIFSHSLVVLIFVFVPTSEVGALISIFAGLIGGAISIDNLGPKPIAVIFTAGFFYTLTNIIINWFTVSVQSTLLEGL